MGNDLKIPQLFNDISNQHLIQTEQTIKQKIQQVNTAFQHNKIGLGLKITLNENNIKYDKRNWKRSTISGKVVIRQYNKQVQQFRNSHNNNNNKLKQQNQQHQLNFLPSYQDDIHFQQHSITISPQDLNTLHQQIINLSTITNQQLSQQQQTPTPQQNSVQDQCCICLQNKTSMVLPCSHAFCDQCTIKYIIQAQQKKCPQCRHEIKGSRQTVGRQIFTVVQDEQVFEQVRKDIVHVIGRMNPTVAKIITGSTIMEKH